MPASAGSRGSSRADHAGGGHRHLLRLDAQSLGRGGLLRRARSRGRARPSPTFEWAGVGDHRPQRVRARLARHHHRRAHARVGGEARGRHRVRRVAHEHAHVEALGLDARPPRRRPGSPRGSAVGSSSRHVRGALDPARAEEASLTRAPPSRQPEHQVQVLHAPGRPRPSRGCRWRANASVRSPDHRHVHAAAVGVAARRRVCGGSSTTSTNGSSA